MPDQHKAVTAPPKHIPKHSTWLELALLFLPAIPAYLWAWPNLSGMWLEIFQIITYLYVLAGTLFIGLRRYTPDQLGINRRGLRLTAWCGLVLLAARLMIILSIDWNLQPPHLDLLTRVWDLFYYIFLVGLTEELLFRGLLYRLLEDWRGLRWAIWGSSLGFLLWHVFGQGPLVGFAALLIGLIFALIRWRAGGILGLILLHGLWDLETVWLVAGSNVQVLGDLSQITIASRLLAAVGGLLLALVPLYLWKGYRRLPELQPPS
jgi:membrane protease YdiL (CAAX protease family)